MKLQLQYIIGILVFSMGCHVHKSQLSEFSQGSLLKEYVLIDEEYGTQTTVRLDGEVRIIETNALPNHKTGNFPNKGNPNSIRAQRNTYKFPIHPRYTGEARWVREPGVAINGVKFEPETAERVECESGQSYRIEAKQDLFDLGLDFNNAHVQPTGAYHYHGTPIKLVESLESNNDLQLIGFARDGFLMYYSKSGRYASSYRLRTEPREGDDCEFRNPHHSKPIALKGTKPDGTFKSDWEYVEGLGELDECNGITLNGQYLYIITDSYPYVSRCLMGEFKEDRRPPGPRPGGRRPPPRRGG